MKKHPTFEELKQNTIDSNKKMSWFSEKYNKIFFSKFESDYFDCCCNLRRNSIFLTRYTYNIPSIITDDYLISDYISLSLKKSFSKQGIGPSCVQAVTHAISKMITNPSSLSMCIQEYFKENFDEQKKLKDNFDHSDFYIFTHCIFPSIFGYFIFPDIMKNAVLLIKSFFYNNNYDFATHLICAFFENTPDFLDTLFTLYEEKKFLEDKKKTSMKYFNYFIEALSVARTYLTSYHHEIIESVLEVGNHIFLVTFVNNLFLPQIKLRNSKDILIQILNFISSHEESPPFQVLLKTLSDTKFYMLDELSILGGFNTIDMKYYNICLSGYEIKILLNLNEFSDDTLLRKKALESCSKSAFSKFTTIPLKIYPSFNHLYPISTNNQNKVLIFPPFKIAVFKRVNEEYRRCFNNIKAYAKNSEIDQIMFFVPELVNPSSESKVNQVVSKMHWENNDHFLRFAYVELSNQYAEAASQFEKIISYKFCKNYFKKIKYSSDSLFECQIAGFRFDKNLELTDDFAFRKKILKFNYNEIEPFTDMTDSFRFAFTHISATEREMYEIIKPKLELMNNTKSVINHILQTYIPYIIRKIPKYINQFSQIAKDLYKYDEIKQDKCFFLLLFSIIDSWKAFFDTFCIFFSFFSKEVSDTSLFANQIKKSWGRVRNCFQNVVYKEAPSIEEYINSLLL